MADKKLSALVELAVTPDADDEIYIRDVSEAAPDESKRITVANLAATADSKIATHASDRDAHMSDFYQTLRTGVNIPFAMYLAYTRPLAANTMYAVPIIIARPITIGDIAFKVTAGGGGGTNARVGLYSNGVNLYPGTLLKDFGTAAVDGAAIKSVAAAPAQAITTLGLYWIVILTDGTPTLQACAGTINPVAVILGLTATYTSQSGWTVAQAYGALPDPFTAGGVLDAGNMPAMSYVIDSLD